MGLAIMPPRPVAEGYRAMDQRVRSKRCCAHYSCVGHVETASAHVDVQSSASSSANSSWGLVKPSLGATLARSSRINKALGADLWAFCFDRRVESRRVSRVLV